MTEVGKSAVAASLTSNPCPPYWWWESEMLGLCAINLAGVLSSLFFPLIMLTVHGLSWAERPKNTFQASGISVG